MTVPPKRSVSVPTRAIAALLVIAGLLAPGNAAGPSAQEPSSPPPGNQQPTFGAGTTVVRVDVYPRRDGKVVEDLRAENFQVFEDGKLQAVDSFEFVRVERNTPDAERRDPTSASDGLRQAANPRNRVFVVYLDAFHTTVSGSHEAREPLVNFLVQALGPTDLFAITHPELPVSQLTFARRTETLEHDLAVNWTWGTAERAVAARNNVETRLMDCARGDIEFGEALVLAHRDDLSSTHLANLVGRLRDLRDERKNIVFVSEGWVARPPRSGAASTGVGPGLPGIGIDGSGRLGTSNSAGFADAAWCNTQISRFQGVDSEKRLHDLLDEARRANVAFYPIDVGGLKTGMLSTGSRLPYGGSAADATAFREYTDNKLVVLQNLAENTDGIAIVGTNDLNGGAKRIADDLSGYYLLMYYPTNVAADGRYRSIEVKVNQPGIRVSARRGYLAATEAMRRAEAAAAARPVTGPTPVDEALERLARVRPDSQLNIDGRLTASSLDVVAEIASREIDAGRWRTGGAVAVSVTGPGLTTPLAGEGTITPGQRGTIVNLPLPTGVSSTAAATWRVTVRVRGNDGTLDDAVEVKIEPPSAVSAPLVYRATPSPRSPLAPVADMQFRRTERVHVEWPVNGNLTTPAARLLSRRGDALPVPVTVTEREDASGRTIVADVVLTPLAQGDYAIELTGTSGADPARYLVAFRLVR